ncbi:MAG TPA: lipid-A-disaccharide synthase N-terminal domain-containing protein [Planctomycetota bacterium]|nr:lipid-A-disaccharide synthase N-terminal domain-containing protein [Planctomycetota bacterium]
MGVEILPASLEAAVGAGLHAEAWVKLPGWLGQGFFAARVIAQWLASERARRPVAPRVFWYLSCAGAVLLTAYSVLRGEVVMVPGYVVTLLIYLRNLRIESRGVERQGLSPFYLVLLGIVIATGPYAFDLIGTHGRETASWSWLALAILGQAMWVGRFVVQWSHAERHGKSEFPTAFWWLTIAGCSLLLAYSLHRGDHVFIFGFLLSWFTPVRNLMLHHKHANAT